MVLLPGCVCCKTCSGLGPLCRYVFSVDNGETWTDPTLSIGTTTTLALPEVSGLGVTITPEMSVWLKSEYELHVAIRLHYYDGSRQLEINYLVRIVGFRNTQALPDNYVYYLSIGFDGWASGVFNGVYLYPELRGGGFPSLWIVGSCQNRPDAECGGLRGDRFYMPEWDISTSSDGNLLTYDVSTNEPDGQYYPRIYFNAPTYSLPFIDTQSLVPGDFVGDTFAGFYDFLLNLKWLARVNPLP